MADEQINVIIQVRTTPELAATASVPVATSSVPIITEVPGIEFDVAYNPVLIPPPPPVGADGADGFGMAPAFTEAAPSTHVVRAAVPRDELENFLDAARGDANVVGVFADPRMMAINEAATICPAGPAGTDRDVEQLLLVEELQERGLDGTGVKVVIVDSGVDIDYLRRRGKAPEFDAQLSWGPQDGQPLGHMAPAGHGTMCAYDVCIAAPACTLVDHALLTSRTAGGSRMEGLLSDAVRSYALLLGYLTGAPPPFAGADTTPALVVNNSWGMFHPSWDFPVGHASNYSANPAHPFNIIVENLESVGADILFAAGNCGPQCPDRRCQQVTNAGIYGANSSPVVTSVAGVMTNGQRIGYSTQGPGLLENNKPDIASYTHFAGSGVWAADGGTSAATPVAAGVVAAIRRLYPPSVLSPAQMRDLLRNTANPRGNGDFNYEYGYGVINVRGLLDAL